MTDKTRPLVTIAIPTYNRADNYLRQSLNASVNQTYSNIEIIVSDNCSNDNTEMLVKSFIDPRIRYFKHKKNIGANKNFNFCVKQAQGVYFLLLQDDDLIDSDFIDTCMKATNYSTDEGIIRTGTRIINLNGTVTQEFPNNVHGLSTEEFFRGWFAYKTALYLCSTLFNTKRLIEIGGFKSKHNLFQDVVAEVQLAAKFGRVDVRDIKASFRKHSGEMTFATKVKNWSEDSLLLLDMMCDLVSEEYKETVKEEGMTFFSIINYNRANAVKSPFNRFITYATVFKMFNYKYLPPPVKNFLYRNTLYRRLRLMRGK